MPLILEYYHQVSLGIISENPTLDALWAVAADDWKDPSEDDNQLLKEIMSENLAGCLKFVKVNTQLVESCECTAFSTSQTYLITISLMYFSA